MDDLQHRPAFVTGRELQVPIDYCWQISGRLAIAKVQCRVAERPDEIGRTIVSLQPHIVGVQNCIALTLNTAGMCDRAIYRGKR